MNESLCIEPIFFSRRESKSGKRQSRILLSVKKSSFDGRVEQVVNEDVVVAGLDEGEAALPLDMCDVTVDVDPPLDLHLLQHGVAQDVEAHWA